MSAAIRKVSIEAGEVCGGIERDRPIPVVNVQELLEVEDLYVMIICLAGDDNVVLKCADFSPAACRSTRGLRKTSKVAELSSTCDLCYHQSTRSKTVSLGYMK